jgi:hypothetical protein
MNVPLKTAVVPLSLPVSIHLDIFIVVLLANLTDCNGIPYLSPVTISMNVWFRMADVPHFNSVKMNGLNSLLVFPTVCFHLLLLGMKPYNNASIKMNV